MNWLISDVKTRRCGINPAYTAMPIGMEAVVTAAPPVGAWAATVELSAPARVAGATARLPAGIVGK